MTKKIKFQIHHNKENIIVLDTSSEDDPHHCEEEHSSMCSQNEVDNLNNLYSSPRERHHSDNDTNVIIRKKPNKLVEGMLSLKILSMMQENRVKKETDESRNTELSNKNI